MFRTALALTVAMAAPFAVAAGLQRLLSLLH
jgi:hypothetical protein